MTTAAERTPERAARDDATLSIGAVCDALKTDFPSISVSKIRYLEDQKLVSPKRTPGGYRLFSQDDLERLRTILRLQRDEFLPLRVIRQELESTAAGTFTATPQAKQITRARLSDPAPTRRYGLDEVLERTGASPALVRDLEQYSLVDAHDGFDEVALEVIQSAAELAQYGVEPRHLRLFRTAAEREAGLLEQLLNAGLRSRNPERRAEAFASLEELAGLVSQMRHLLLVAELRSLVQPST
jgi:DNA-binding transcriptional MerR regulator